jgi:hypothetical protein
MESPLKLEEQEFLLKKYSSMGYSRRAASARLNEVVMVVRIPTLD